MRHSIISIGLSAVAVTLLLASVSAFAAQTKAHHATRPNATPSAAVVPGPLFNVVPGALLNVAPGGVQSHETYGPSSPNFNNQAWPGGQPARY